MLQAMALFGLLMSKQLGCIFWSQFVSLVGRNLEWGPRFLRRGLHFSHFFFNLKATQLKLPQYRLLFEVQRLRNYRWALSKPIRPTSQWGGGVAFKSAGKTSIEHSSPKTLESGTEQKLQPEFLRNLQPREKWLHASKAESTESIPRLLEDLANLFLLQLN
jgi:hypothetical protein